MNDVSCMYKIYLFLPKAVVGEYKRKGYGLL